MDDDFGRIVRLLILTVQRRSEIADLANSEIDAAERQIKLPGHRTKNGREHVVPLSDLVWEFLESVDRREGRELLFGRGARGFGGWSKSKGELDERLAENRRRAGIEKAMPPWTSHDLRRSGSTHLHERGFAFPHVVEAIINMFLAIKAALQASTIAPSTCTSDGWRWVSGPPISFPLSRASRATSYG